jgi:uncharacterized membrane protein
MYQRWCRRNMSLAARARADRKDKVILSKSATIRATSPIGRLQILDIVRGLAVIGMVIFHGGWDLGNFRIVNPIFLSHWGWLWFSYVIAGGFILIAGMAQAFAAMNAQPRARFWRRFAEIAAAALLITIVTRFVYPTAFIFFGILHHIAVASLLLLVAERLATILLLGLAVALLVLPHFEIGGVFNQAWLVWLGLADYFPETFDFVPIAPWFALGLSGMILARWARRYWSIIAPLACWRGDQGRYGVIVRSMVFLGRHSLAIYLLHQPLLWGMAYLWANYAASGVE